MEPRREAGGHVNRVCDSVQSCFETDVYSDLTFVCRDNKRIGAHQVVLCGFSPLLKQCCKPRNGDHATIILPDVDHHILKLLLVLLYAGYTQFSSIEEVSEFLTVVTVLGVELPEPVTSQLLAFAASVREFGVPCSSGVTPQVKEEPPTGVSDSEAIGCEEAALDASTIVQCLLTPATSMEEGAQHFWYLPPDDGAQDVQKGDQVAAGGVPDTGGGDMVVTLTPTRGTRERDEPAGGKGFQCVVCGRWCRDSHNLRVHMRSHTGERPFSCATCGKTFIQKQHLNRHSRLHGGSKPVCCNACGSGFLSQSELNQHLPTCPRHLLPPRGRSTAACQRESTAPILDQT